MIGAALAHEVTGELSGAVPLLLGPSLGTSRRLWQPQLDRLAEVSAVVRFDPRGHGDSPVPPGPYRIEELAGDVLALADRLGIDAFIYCGLSIGGMIGMWLAAHVPTRVRALALLCTSAYLPPEQNWRDRATLVRAEGTGAVAEAALRRWFTDGYRDRDPDTVAVFARQLRATPAEGYAGCCEAIAAMDLRPVLDRITAPTLVISGEQDPATPPEHGAAIAAGVPGARYVCLPDAAHLANVEQPDAVTELLLDHFREEPAR